jgi:hypothetical protein
MSQQDSLVYCYQSFMYENEHYVQSKISFTPDRANAYF